MSSGEEDFTKRMKGMIDLWWIKGVLLQDPTIAACLPISVENTAIAYDAANDRFKIVLEAITASITNDMTDRAARLVGIIYGDQGQLLQRPTTKDLLVQLRHNAAEIDPRAIRALTNSDIVTVVQATAASLKATVTQDDSERSIGEPSGTITFTPISATETGDVITIASGYKAKVYGFFFYSSAAITVELRFKTSGNVIGGLTVTGAVGFNFVGMEKPLGADNEEVEIYLSGAGTVKGWVEHETVAA